MALKLDMSKAYDRIEWEFVRAVLASMGFPKSLVQLLLSFITMVTHQVFVNGQPSSDFKPERGLRQGDPFSPYLFVLCADVMSRLLRKEAGMGGIHGIQVARNAPKLTHLLFVDDSLLFTRAIVKEIEFLMDVLKTYQEASGQLINFDKSEASFSRNMDERDRNIILNRMRVKTVEAHSRYLGLPSLFGRSKKIFFSQVTERV